MYLSQKCTLLNEFGPRPKCQKNSSEKVIFLLILVNMVFMTAAVLEVLDVVFPTNCNYSAARVSPIRLHWKRFIVHIRVDFLSFPLQ